MENELRNFVIGQYGMNAWQDILRIQADIRKKRKQEQIEHQQFIDDCIIWGLIAGAIAITLVIIIGIIMAMP
jgi:CHASE3 domain sensor protein